MRPYAIAALIGMISFVATSESRSRVQNENQYEDAPKQTASASKKKLASIRRRLDGLKQVTEENYDERQAPVEMEDLPYDPSIAEAESEEMQSEDDSSMQEDAMPQEKPIRSYSAPPQEPQAAVQAPKSSPNKQAYEKKLIALFEKCTGLGKLMEDPGAKGAQVRKIYGDSCSSLVSKFAIPQKLDLLYPVQGKYLSMVGDHKKANLYFTLMYQNDPLGFEPNFYMIQNLIHLGEKSMAKEMLEFYTSQTGVQLSPKQEARLKQLVPYLQGAEAKLASR